MQNSNHIVQTSRNSFPNVYRLLTVDDNGEINSNANQTVRYRESCAV